MRRPLVNLARDQRRAKLREAFALLCPELSIRRFDGAFTQIAIAEQEIEKVYPRRGRKTMDPPGLFMACVPSSLFDGRIPEVYRHHVKELVQRSKRKKPNYTEATRAEVLLALLIASHAAPLNTEGMVLVTRLFEEILGESFGDPTPEQWEGQFDELLAESRQKVKTGR